jgi:hypothetical protein
LRRRAWGCRISISRAEEVAVGAVEPEGGTCSRAGESVSGRYGSGVESQSLPCAIGAAVAGHAAAAGSAALRVDEARCGPDHCLVVKRE